MSKRPLTFDYEKKKKNIWETVETRLLKYKFKDRKLRIFLYKSNNYNIVALIYFKFSMT